MNSYEKLINSLGLDERCKIYVPRGCVAVYETTHVEGWEQYNHKITADYSDYEDLTPPSNEIWYTSINDELISPVESAFGVNLISNVYKDGKGVLTFDGDVTHIGDYAFQRSVVVVVDEVKVNYIIRECYEDVISQTKKTREEIVEPKTKIVYERNNMVSVFLPNSVVEISPDAFHPGEIIEYMHVGDGLKSISLGSLWHVVKFGGGYAYSNGCCLIINGVLKRFATNCGESSYTIPEGVTEIGNRAFRGCISLKNINIPNSVTKIGWGAFLNCSSLESITIPEGVTEIGNRAFMSCKSLKNINIPNSVTKIGNRAFTRCSSLEKITLPDSLTEIGGCAFEGCSNLESITIPDGVTEIGDCTFINCENLQQVNIGSSVTGIGHAAFKGCFSLESITIPDGVKKIESWAFESCRSLRQITLPDSVTEIESRAFEGCQWLESITIPVGVSTIQEETFKDCHGLEKVIIHSGVTTLNVDLFYYAKTVYCKSSTPPNIIENVGGIVRCCVLYVPRKYVEIYKKTYVLLASKIEGYDF